MRTRLVRIACLFASAALGVALLPAQAEAKPTSSTVVETSKVPPAPDETSKAPPEQAPKAPSVRSPSAQVAETPRPPSAGTPTVDAASPPAATKAASPSAGAKKKAKAPEPPPLPPAPARMWLIAPTPRGPWTLRIDNEGDRPMRIPADVRLLRLEIDTFDQRNKKKTFRCAAPAGLKPSGFPERRALLLAPGQSFIERFDPRLLCFGKDEAALTGGAVVRTWYGWGPPPKGSKKPPTAPFAAESTDDPPAFAPAVGLAAPTVVLSHERPSGREAAAADKPAAPTAEKSAASAAGKPDASAADKPAVSAAGKPDASAADKPTASAADKPTAPPNERRGTGASNEPIVDANAPRLELTSEPWSDAASPRSIVVRVSAKNAGKRPMTVALRPRMLEFQVDGPNGTTVCEASPATNAIPRDMYRTLRPGASLDLSVLLKEVCPGNTFAREGLYEVTATLHANESGSNVGLDAYTAVVPAKNATLVRVKSAPEPFYSAAPRAVPTPAPEDGHAPKHENE